MSQEIRSHNFASCGLTSRSLSVSAALAERYFRDDPDTCLLKLRQLAELLAWETAARTGRLHVSAEETQSDLLRRNAALDGVTGWHQASLVPARYPI